MFQLYTSSPCTFLTSTYLQSFPLCLVDVLLMSQAFLIWEKRQQKRSSTLLTPEVQSPSGVRSPSLFITASSFLFIIPSLIVCASCGITARGIRGRGGWRACDGDWRAEPQPLSRSEGSQSGPTLPQHPLRISIQAVRTAEGLQR